MPVGLGTYYWLKVPGQGKNGASATPAADCWTLWRNQIFFSVHWSAWIASTYGLSLDRAGPIIPRFRERGKNGAILLHLSSIQSQSHYIALSIISMQLSLNENVHCMSTIGITWLNSYHRSQIRIPQTLFAIHRMWKPIRAELQPFERSTTDYSPFVIVFQVHLDRVLKLKLVGDRVITQRCFPQIILPAFIDVVWWS